MWPSGTVLRIRTSGLLRLMDQRQAPAAWSKVHEAAVGVWLCGGETFLYAVEPARSACKQFRH